MGTPVSQVVQDAIDTFAKDVVELEPDLSALELVGLGIYRGMVIGRCLPAWTDQKFRQYVGEAVLDRLITFDQVEANFEEDIRQVVSRGGQHLERTRRSRRWRHRLGLGLGLLVAVPSVLVLWAGLDTAVAGAVLCPHFIHAALVAVVGG